MLLLSSTPLRRLPNQTQRQRWQEQVYQARFAFMQDCIEQRPMWNQDKFGRDIGYIAEMRLLQVCLPLLYTLDRIEKRVIQIQAIAKGISYAPPRYR